MVCLQRVSWAVFAGLTCGGFVVQTARDAVRHPSWALGSCRGLRKLAGTALLASFVLATAASAELTLYVSPQGADTSTGTKEQPFATLSRARDEIRKMRPAGGLPAGGVVVELAGGRYDLAEPFVLDKQDSGTAESPVTYRCAVADRAWLVAGRDIPLSALAPLTDPNLLARIPEDARTHVLCLDLKKLGIEYYTRLPDRFNCFTLTRKYPEKYGYKPEYGYVKDRFTPFEAFCDGIELTPARWPNRDYIRIDEVLDDGAGSPFEHSITRGGTFRLASQKERLKRWAGAEELILNGYFYRDYFCCSTRVAKIDLENATVTLSAEVLDKKNKPHQRFYAHHLPEELDLPGEWYLHCATGILCLWPPDGARTLTFPVLREAIVRLDGAAHVTIRGLGLEGGRHHAVEIKDGESNRIVACEIRNVGRDGVTVQGGRDHRVLGCDIHHTGQAGIRLDGGDRTSLTPAGHVAENNHIHHTSRLLRNYTSPIVLNGVGNRATRNLVHHVPHIAVLFSGNDHIMELNEIFLAAEETNECGVFYTGRDWTARGNIIRNNFLHHITGVPDWGVNFVHLDDSASGTEIHGNILYKMEDGVAICGGNENRVHDNLFVECRETVELAPRGIDMFQSDDKGGFVVNSKNAHGIIVGKRLLQYKWNQPPYSTRYPKLVEIFTKTPIAAPWWNEVVRNVAVDCGRHVQASAQCTSDWECIVKDNWIVADPGFVQPDHAELDFRLKPDAEVQKNGFQPIPLEQIGLYASPDRASWPVAVVRPAKDWKPRWMLRKEAEAGVPVRIFPVADIKQGRHIVIDGAVEPEEWSPPGYDGSEPNRHGAAELEWGADAKTVSRPSQAYVETDGAAFYVAFINGIDPARGVSGGHAWGRDDAVEVSLAVADPPEAVQGRERAFVFRGFADGHVEGSMESGWTPVEVERSMKGVEFAAKVVNPGTWTAEWRIPFASFGFTPESGNRPVLANLSVRKVADDSWVQWKDKGGCTWEIHGGCALWVKPFGALPFVPGSRPTEVRIDVQAPRDVDTPFLEAGPGSESPSWGKNRLVASFGTVRADRWQDCRFEFTPLADTTVAVELMGSRGAWTYYDNFRVEGAELANPDFEQTGEDGKVPGWSYVLEQNNKALGRGTAGVVAPVDGAVSGTHVAQANHDNRVVQNLKVAKGQRVVVCFQARAALPGVGR